MTDSPFPIRVLVKGNSSVLYVAPMSGPRTDLGYPRVLEHHLGVLGHEAAVDVAATVGERTWQGLRSWEAQVLQRSPDVVVLHYGLPEAGLLAMPRRFERYVNSYHHRPGRWRDPLRQKAVRPVYVLLARLQSKVDGLLGGPVVERRIRRMVADLDRLIDQIDRVQHPLVLLPLLVPATGMWAEWFPGVNHRIDATNAAFTALVEGLGKANVRTFDAHAAALAAGIEPGDDLTPDGGHYSAAAHRAVGEALAVEVAAWAAGVGHLRLD